MKTLMQLILFAFVFASQNALAEAYSCFGRVPNPITDIAWISIFPIKIGSVPVAGFNQPDIGENPPPICACPLPHPPWIRIGLGITFWEPARAVEATTTPMCAPILGGSSLGGSSSMKRGSAETDYDNRNSFFNVHWYKFPLTNWMSWLTDTACDNGDGFDLLMLSEYEPTWADDELSTIFSPEAILFANPIAQAACAADCIAASLGFPLNVLFWCAGCQGSMYPLTGNVKNHESGIQASLLVTQRMHNKMHRSFLSWDVNSVASMCIALPQPIMNKQSYKTQMLYPIPNTLGAHPYGRSEAFWSAGKEFPVAGEDFSYLIWRRRVCCAF